MLKMSGCLFIANIGKNNAETFPDKINSLKNQTLQTMDKSEDGAIKR